MHIMKRDRNTNCFEYIATYKTSCSWYTRVVEGCWRRGGVGQEEVSFEQKGVEEHDSEKSMVHSLPARKNGCHIEKFQSLRNKTWRKEVCRSKKGNLARIHASSLGKCRQLVNVTNPWLEFYIFFQRWPEAMETVVLSWRYTGPRSPMSPKS